MINPTLVVAGNGGPEPTWSQPRRVSFLFLTSLHSPSARPRPVRARRACRTAGSAAGLHPGRAPITSAGPTTPTSIGPEGLCLGRRKRLSRSWHGSEASEPIVTWSSRKLAGAGL